MAHSPNYPRRFVEPIRLNIVASESVATRQILSMKDLGQGWHYGEGVAIAQKVIERAVNVSRFTSSQVLNAEAFPLLDGRVLVVIYKMGRELEIRVGADAPYSFTIAEDEEPIQSWKSGSLVEGFQKFFINVNGEVWHTSDSSITDTTVTSLDVSSPTHSRKTMAGYQFSTPSVFAGMEKLCVGTWVNITHLPLAIQSSFGWSKKKMYPQNVR